MPVIIASLSLSRARVNELMQLLERVLGERIVRTATGRQYTSNIHDLLIEAAAEGLTEDSMRAALERRGVAVTERVPEYTPATLYANFTFLHAALDDASTAHRAVVDALISQHELHEAGVATLTQRIEELTEAVRGHQVDLEEAHAQLTDLRGVTERLSWRWWQVPVQAVAHAAVTVWEVICTVPYYVQRTLRRGD
ncbi:MULTISPECIES: hypothetical protein [Deinococcus]|uniref:Uncharacterized protein n=1 Tax=Deinococcus rufus TaxID=2136097 RepID=A0ABV7Z7D4_9DEIO|nr:hypothetical protein [Deinococcus sp. AB2017081]WQE94671.1 hypothetical protein U2P90_14845 [Deinococcus sp. AB2017081]